MNLITKLLSIVIAGIFLSVNFACTKTTVEPGPSTPVNTGSVQFDISYEIDGESLYYDTNRYQNDFGNVYGITKLEYYISDITFIGETGNKFTHHRVNYLNAKMDSTNVIHVENVPVGNYSHLELSIGLNSDSNLSNNLPSTLENLNMFWPEPMGGGYHFIKMEGRFVEGNGAKGYAMHVGTNTCLIAVTIEQPIVIGAQNQIELRMNINEWFRDPIIFDLATANYIMGDQEKMLEIAGNGHNIFSIK